jgi:hypothetical protein
MSIGVWKNNVSEKFIRAPIYTSYLVPFLVLGMLFHVIQQLQDSSLALHLSMHTSRLPKADDTLMR